MDEKIRTIEITKLYEKKQATKPIRGILNYFIYLLIDCFSAGKQHETVGCFFFFTFPFQARIQIHFAIQMDTNKQRKIKHRRLQHSVHYMTS